MLSPLINALLHVFILNGAANWKIQYGFVSQLFCIDTSMYLRDRTSGIKNLDTY